MFRTKKDVERHVSDVLSKIDNENEKYLRGYTFARLFFQVKDYESAKKYLSGFLSVRDHHAASHRLLAQIYEATNNPESALQSYKRSLEIDSQQNDIVLKICELYCKLPVDHETARYWADRAEQLFPHHEAVFKLREYLVSAEGEPDRQELENLIATELAAQPKNIDLRIKLLRLYLDSERVAEAYKHSIMIESKQLFSYSIDWYYLLGDIFEQYQDESEDLDSQYYINYLTALDHLVFLTLAEPHTLKDTAENGKKSPSLNDAAAVLLTFDQVLKKAAERDSKEGSWSYFMLHMKGQLYFHLTSLLMKRLKMDQGNRKEALRFISGLALVTYSFKPVNLLQEVWFTQMEDNQKIFTNFFQRASLRTSFIGHVLLSLYKTEKSSWLQKIKVEICIPQVKERIYSRIVSSLFQKDKLSSSYFISDPTFELCSLELPTEVVLNEYDKSAFRLCPDSLHHLVWLELERENYTNRYHENIAEIFKNLQYSNKNLSKGSCESLCVLDLEAYLHATVFQAKVLIEKKNQLNKNDVSVSYPPDIADSLCTKVQTAWWKAAHGLSASTIKDKLSEHRRCLQQGLEVIRGVGNHGMEVQLMIHLAHTFANKAEAMEKNSEKKTDKSKSKIVTNNVAALYSRATHYWNIALGLLEKLSSGHSLHVPKDPMFTPSDKALSKDDIKGYQEAGKLFVAVRQMDADKLNEAAELLSKLSSPYASFYLAQTLMKLASQESRYSSPRIALLNRAKLAIHDTMDRIKDDKTHELNKELFIILEDVENELGHEFSVVQDNSLDDSEETDTYDGTSILNSSNNWRENSTSSYYTARPSSKFTPLTQRSSRISTSENHVQHFEPSPERLDAQVRALALNQDNLMKSILKHQENLLETINVGNKSIVEAVNQNTQVMTQLKKEMEGLKLSVSQNHAKTDPKKLPYFKSQSNEDEEYYDPHAILDYFEEGGEDYRAAAAYGFDRSSRLVHEAHPGATAPPINYVVSPALPHGAAPTLNHYNYQYPPQVLPTPAPPPAAVAERTAYYHPPGQGLPFSEGQQLPQFHFHVASSVVKPPPLSMTNSLPPQVVSTLPPGSLPQQPPIMVPPVAPLPPQTPWSKPANVPHSFQIPLPTSTVFVSACTVPPALTTVTPAAATSQSQLKELLQTPPATTKTITFGLPPVSASTPNSGMFSGFAQSPETPKEKSRCDSESATSPDIDLEREVMGDFKPLIPLPAEVEVETGEENETVLFENRAKLYRFVDQEWKERGIGFVKILHDEASGKVRLLMRRDQVLKVCANHYITSNMEVQPMKNSDKAWIWVAQDFADEKLQPEKLCIRFKTPEIANAFKLAFNKAVEISKAIETSKRTSPKSDTTITHSSMASQPFGGKFAPKPGSWTCPTCYVTNGADKVLCVACDTIKPGSQATTTTPVTSPLSSASKSLFQTPPTSSSFKFGSPSPSFITASSSEVIPTSNAASKNVLGGFTFSSNPVIKELEMPETKEREILVVSTKTKDGPQVTKIETSKASPFTGFSFNKATDNFTVTSKSSSPFSGLSSSASQSSIPSNFSLSNIKSSMEAISPTFVFAKNAINDAKSSIASMNTQEPLVINVSSEGRRVSTEAADTAPEDFVPNVEFKPVVPLPALIDLKTGEEDEEILFCERAKLFRFDSETKEWKERGIGEIKILHIKESQKYRILMRRDQVHKLCANHYILPEMELTSLNNSDKAWIWVAQDYSDGEMIQIKLAARFKTSYIAQEFFNVFERCKKELLKGKDEANPSGNSCIGNKNAFEQLVESSSQDISKLSIDSKTQKDTIEKSSSASNFDKPLSEFFKPQTGSWECSSCYVRNNADSIKCAACETAKPGTLTSTADTTNLKFGTSSSSNAPLSELFKPKAGSWECSSCYVVNNADASKCASCEMPKFSNAFTPTSSTDLNKFHAEVTTSNTTSNFTFGQAKPSEFVFGVKPTTQPATFAFGPGNLTKSDESTSKLFSAFDQKANNLASIFGGSGSQKTDSSTTSLFGGFGTQKPESSAKPVFGAFGQKTDTPTSTIFGPQKTNSSTSIFSGTGALNTDSNTNIFSGDNAKSIFGSTAVFGTQKTDSTPIFKPQKTDSSSTIFGGTGTLKQNSNTSIFGGSDSKLIFGNINTGKPETTQSGVTSKPVFSFGSSNDNKDNSSSGFHFGSPQKYEFNFSGVRPRSPTKTPKSPRSPETPSDVEDDEDESFDADNIYFTPVIPLPPKVDVKTGEENEKTLFCKRAKLFRFCSGEWKERGIGDFKILHDEVNGRIRFLMRRDQVLKVCLNHYLNSDIVFENRNDKTLSWAVKDFSENEPSDEIFALRFKTAEFANEFLSAVEDARKLIGQPISAAGDSQAASTDAVTDVKKAAALFSFKTEAANQNPAESSFFTTKEHTGSFFLDQNSSSTFKFGQAPVTTKRSKQKKQDDEIEIVYESEWECTPEDKVLAEKLKLSPFFFAYKDKPPCPGCVGCEDYDPSKKAPADALYPPKCAKTAQYESDTDAEPEQDASEFADPEFLSAAEKSLGFADVSTTVPATFGSSSSQNFGFEGAGTPLFASQNNKNENADGDGNVEQGPDVHFEPVIPLPDLVEVKTGEEDETPIFVQRAKLFKFDMQKKEWKERGVGELKILSHNEKLRFRILQRRDQVHKVACNHCIEPSMELSPMSTTLTAVCWTAMDFSEGTGEVTQFAARFKNEEIVNEFKLKFNECLAQLKSSSAMVQGSTISSSEEQAQKLDTPKVSTSADPGSAIVQDIPKVSTSGSFSDQSLKAIVQEIPKVSSAGSLSDQNSKIVVQETPKVSTTGSLVDPSSKTVLWGNAPTMSSFGDLRSKITQKTSSNFSTSTKLGNQNYRENRNTQFDTSSSSEDDDEDVDDEEDDDDISEIQFEKRCTLEISEINQNNFKNVGMGTLKILYDDNVYGYRLFVVSDTEEILCEHIIAIQTCVNTEKKNKVSWAAIDLAVDPPRRRKFRAAFSSNASVKEFIECFEEGKEAAVQSEIVENTENTFVPSGQHK